jgi:hypothetical protein
MGQINGHDIIAFWSRQAMSQHSTKSRIAFVCVGFSILGSLATSTGCQVSVAGQTLPSAYYLDDDIQYFPTGPKNKLSNETAALKKAREESKLRAQR